MIWQCTTASLSSLLVANALAARSHPNHPFRYLESEMLKRAMSTFNAAYRARNEKAHFVPMGDDWIASNEVLFLANSVLTIVDQFMSLSIKLIERKDA